jgi:hypothetical protein
MYHLQYIRFSLATSNAKLGLKKNVKGFLDSITYYLLDF